MYVTTINRKGTIFLFDGDYLYAKMIEEAKIKFNTFYFLAQYFRNKI